MSKVALANCDVCPLKANPLVPPRGPSGDAAIVLIGEAPGRDEVRLGKVFIGRSGQLLQRCLDAHQLTDVWITNACLCFVDDVNDKEAASYCCKPRLIAEIRSKHPKVVVPMGNIPTNVLLGGGLTGITAKRGKVVVSVELGTQVLPTFHPAAILRRADTYPDFASDLQKAVAISTGATVQVGSPKDVMPPAEATADFARAFASAEKGTYTILDLETSGYSYVENKILCVVLGTEEGIFVITPDAVYDPA